MFIFLFKIRLIQTRAWSWIGLSSLNSSCSPETKRTNRSTRNQLHLMYFTHNLSCKYCTTYPPIAHKHPHVKNQKWDLSFPAGSHIRMDFASASSCSHFIRDCQTIHWECGRRWGLVMVSWTFFFNWKETHTKAKLDPCATGCGAQMILDKQLTRPQGGREANKMSHVREQTVRRKINYYY